MLNDVRQALRVMGRTPAFTLTAVLTLAVGIGAAASVYSIYSAVLLKSLPFGDPGRVVAIWLRDTAGGLSGVSGGSFAKIRALPAVEHAALIIGTERTLLGLGDPEVVRGALVTGAFFDVLRVRPVIGRVLDVNDAGGATSPVVISYRLWQRRLNGDAGAVGRPLRLDDRVYTVVGVLPASARYPEDAEFWAPYTLTAAELSQAGRGPFTALGRLNTSHLDAASVQAAVLDSPAADHDLLHVMFVPLVEAMAGPYRSNLTMLFGAVVMVLLIACFNVANLLLARSTAREQELAVRGAVGATRFRLLRQLVVEALALSFMGAAAGLLLAQAIVMCLPKIGLPPIPRVDEVAIDWRVLSFAVGTALASVCIFGVGPAWLATGRVAPALGAGRSVAGPRKRTMSHLLIGLQVAATLALLVGSALALVSLYRLHNVDLGFETRDLTVTTVRPSATTGQQRGGVDLYDSLLDRLREQQDFQVVAMMSHVPLEPVLAAAASVTTEPGAVLREGRNGPRMRILSSGAFQALGVPIVRGRDFGPADRAGTPFVTMVNETLARKLWNGGDPIGKSLWVESRGSKRAYSVIGVARDFRAGLRRPPQPEVYLAARQVRARMKVLVRSVLPPDVVAARIRGVILAEDPTVPISAISTASSLVWDGTADTRFQASLLTAFGLLGVLLASSGILAVVMYTVVRRRREIGIRIAIGAAPHQVVRLLVLETTVPLVGGLAAGAVGVYNLASLLQQQGVLFEVERFEPGLYASVTIAFAIVAILAAWLPARGAARIDPMVALRSE